MSASFKLSGSTFPDGTTVKAYPASNWPTPAQPSGAPIGTAAAEGTVSGSAVTFSGLTAGVAYWAAAKVGTTYRYVGFEAGEDVADSADHATKNDIEIINLGTDWSAGELVSAQLAHNVAGLRMNLLHGTAASPVTAAQPTVKVSRVEKASRAAIGAITGNNAADGAAGLCAGHFSAKGVAGSEGQAIGLFGSAINESSYEGEDGPDAVGLYGIGRTTGGSSSLASCYGLVAYGRRDVATAVANGAEIGCLNYTTTAEAYNPNGSGKARGIWLVAGGEADSGVGITINNPFGFQFDVGIGFGSTEVKGKKGGVKSASIRDDSSSERSILVKGAHSKAAIAVASGAGPIVVGTEEAANASALLEVNGGAEARDPLAVFKVTGEKSARSQIIANGSANLGAFVSGGANGFVTGSVVGDTGLLFTAGKNFFLGAAAKTAVFRASETGLGFYGTAPQAKAEVTGSRGGNAALASLLEKLATVGLISNGTSA